MYMYINEDYIAKWVEKQGGLLITRSIKNIDTFDISQQYNPFYVCITGSCTVFIWYLYGFYKAFIRCL